MNLNDFLSNVNLIPWLIPVGPLLAFFIITLATNRARLVPGTSPEYADHNHPAYPGLLVPVATLNSRILTIIVGLLGIGSAWILSLIVATQALNLPDLGEKVF